MTEIYRGDIYYIMPFYTVTGSEQRAGRPGVVVSNDYSKEHDCTPYYCYEIGENDLTLMRKLFAAGHPHRKYLRQIFVAMDITAPLYWWKEFDTYKVGTTANSCSTKSPQRSLNSLISARNILSDCLSPRYRVFSM